MMRDYKGRNIWIVGASSGIGRALAVELSGRGARLVLSARGAKDLRSLNSELGKKHFVLPLDVAKPKEVAEAAGKAIGRHGRLHSVIFMAGVYDSLAAHEVTPAYARKVFGINVLGAFNLVHAILPLMKPGGGGGGEGGGGQIALCASVAGWRGMPRAQPYSATKAALINYAESLRCEHPELDIRVVNPGFVRTRMTNKNRFTMPMIIGADAAAAAIADGLARGRGFDIHFPRRFTRLMQVLRVVPYGLYFRLMGKRR